MSFRPRSFSSARIRPAWPAAAIALPAAALALGSCKDRPGEEAPKAQPAASSRVVAEGASPTGDGGTTQALKDASASDAADASAANPCPPEMRRVSGGRFWVGSPRGRGADDEHPRFLTELGDYCLDRTEVSSEAYERCVQAGHCSSAERDRKTCNGGRAARGKHPINCVDHAQAAAYCAARGARLPSEIEWEYAARGGDRQLPYPWGEAPPDGRTCWKHHGTCEVGSFEPGAFDLHDIVGNVWEWTESWYAPYPWPAKTGHARVYRGGSWSRRFEKWLSPTLRNRSAPHREGSHLGFRCALTPKAARCPFGRAEDGLRCLHGVLEVQCTPPRSWNGARCAKPGEPRCRAGWHEETGHGCVLDTPIDVAPERVDPSAVQRVRSPEFDEDCRAHAPGRPRAYRLQGGTHKARNQVGARAGCKNRDVGVGWISACCP